MSRDSARDRFNVKKRLAELSGSTSIPSHTHVIADITGLQTALDNKATLAHSHIIADVTGLQSALDGKQVSGSYANSTHSHLIADVTGLQTALDGKQASGSYANTTHSHAISDVTNLQTSLDAKQATLVSATNIKTINGSSLLGSGDLTVTATPDEVGFTLMNPAAGVFISNASNGTALGTQAQVANRNVIAPYVSAFNITIDQLGVSISTAVAATNCKVIVYASDNNGRPSTVLRETANIDCATTGTKFASITSLILTAGQTYWIGIRASGTFTLRTLAVGASPVLSYTNAATPVAQSALILTETFANAAATWSYLSSQHSNALVPLVLMRVA